MEAKLVVVGGDAKPTEIKLKLPAIIGRGRSATLTLPHPLVSRQHCEIFETGGKLFVRDLGSLNGTFVGEEKIQEAQLQSGSLLTVGNVTFRAVYAPDGEQMPPAAAPAAVDDVDEVDFEVVDEDEIDVEDEGLDADDLEFEVVEEADEVEVEEETEPQPAAKAARVDMQSTVSVEDLEVEEVDVEVDEGGAEDVADVEIAEIEVVDDGELALPEEEASKIAPAADTPPTDQPAAALKDDTMFLDFLDDEDEAEQPQAGDNDLNSFLKGFKQK